MVIVSAARSVILIAVVVVSPSNDDGSSRRGFVDRVCLDSSRVPGMVIVCGSKSEITTVVVR